MNAPDTYAVLHEGWRLDRQFSMRCLDWAERAAIEIGGRTITYATLDEASSRLANRLVDKGVRRGHIVAVAAGDIAEFVLGVLAVLKAGAAYLPVDTRYPMTRARDTLELGAAVLVLAGARLPDGQVPAGIPVLRDFDDPAALASWPATPPRVAASGRDAAYVCYTSGSTGKPKGVVVAHRGIEGMVDDPGFLPFQPEDRIAQTSTYAFDGTTFEIWGALLHGACLVDVPRGDLLSPAAFAAFLARERISGMWLTTSLFNAVAARLPGAFGAMRFVLIGGEAADPVSIGRVLDHGRPPGRLINGYGPTEATSLATWHDITPADVAAGIIPIGLPIAGRRVYVMDAAMRPLPQGADGELCIGGPAVAAGYLGEPVLTADKFIADPWSDDPDDRLYRTGDLCRELPDGRIVYLGRIDDQVKVRGFRVEPAGIAAILMGLPGIEEAVVLARDGRFGTRELVAFVRGDGLESGDDLRALAGLHMPDYMVPAAVHVVDTFPLTPSGKMDRVALLEQARGAQAAAGASVPEGPVQAELLEIWRRVLERQDIGMDDEFRDLGGDSMAVMELVFEVEAAFGRTLSIDDVVAPTTIRGLAGLLALPQQPAVPEGVSAFLLSHPFNMMKIPEPIGAAMSRGGPWKQLQIPPSYFDGSRDHSVEAMAAELEAQIREVSPEGPYILGGHSFGGLLAYEIARRLRDKGGQVDLVVLIDSHPATTDSAWRRLRLLGGKLWSYTWLGPAQQLARLYRRTRRHGRAWLGLPGHGGHNERIYRICLDARRAYRPKTYAGAAVIFASTDPAFAGEDGWQGVLQGAVERHSIDADHLSIITAWDNAVRIAEHLTAVMPHLVP
jgi:amino acid adenylation domain-containing protein